MSFKRVERYANTIERSIIKTSRHIFEWLTCGFYCCSIRWSLIRLNTSWRSANRPSKVWDQTQKLSSAIPADRRYMFAHWLTATRNRVTQEIEKNGLMVGFERPNPSSNFVYVKSPSWSATNSRTINGFLFERISVAMSSGIRWTWLMPISVE